LFAYIKKIQIACKSWIGGSSRELFLEKKKKNNAEAELEQGELAQTIWVGSTWMNVNVSESWERNGKPIPIFLFFMYKSPKLASYFCVNYSILSLCLKYDQLYLMFFCPILTFCFKFGELDFLFIDFNFTAKISFDTYEV